jgi:hypothetical protein
VLLFRGILIWVSLTALPACGLIFSRQVEEDSRSVTSEITLEVESHHWADIVVYLMDGTQSQRLGTVNGVSTSSFVFDYSDLAAGGKVRLRAYPVGGQGSFTSEDVLIQPGQWIKWILESDLSRSSMSVY